MKQTKMKQSKTTIGKFIRALFSKDTPGYIKAIVGAAVAYTIFPIDVLPDVLGPIGFLDDAAILTALTSLAMTLLENHKAEENTKKTDSDRDFEEVN